MSHSEWWGARCSMRRSDSPLIIKSTLLAIYGREIARGLRGLHQFRMADQLEGAVISVRNNIGEAQSPQSHRDFISKCKIAQKENFEAEGMLAILTIRDGLSPAQKETVLLLTDEIGKMLTASIVTAHKNMKSSG